MRTPTEKRKGFDRKTVTVFYLNLFLFFSLFFSLYNYIKTENPELIDGLETHMENRFNVLAGKEEESKLQVNTMDIRKDEFALAERHVIKNDVVKELFGCGFGVLTSKSQSGNLQFMLEDQFHSNLLSIGWLGNSLYICIFLYILYVCFLRRKKRRYLYIYAPACMITFIASFTSVCICAIGISLPLALVVVDYYDFIKTSQIGLQKSN